METVHVNGGDRVVAAAAAVVVVKVAVSPLQDIYNYYLQQTLFLQCVILQLFCGYSLWHEVVPKSPRNWNAAQKPLVVQLCTARYHELCPL